MLDLLYIVVHDIWTTMVPPRQTRRYTKCKKKFELKHVETEILKKWTSPSHKEISRIESKRTYGGK